MAPLGHIELIMIWYFVYDDPIHSFDSSAIISINKGIPVIRHWSRDFLWKGLHVTWN